MNYKNYFKQRLLESALSENRKRGFGEDPRGISDPSNFGLNTGNVPPGSYVSHGDIHDKSDIISHHTNMLQYALQSNNKKDIEKHLRAIQNAGGDPNLIMSQLKNSM